MPTAANTNGSGSIYQRKSDGRWCASISLGKKRIVRYSATEREAKQALQAMVREFHLGTLAAPTRTTLAEWVEQWLKQAETELRPSTVRTYCQTLEPLVASLGHLRLDRLNAALIAGEFAALKRKGKGARRLQLAHGYLKACLDQAVALDVLGSNPMAKVPRPRWEPRERRYWTIEEATRFVAITSESPTKWAPLFTILVTCGLRISEALALRWADVDVRAGTVTIERALVWAGNRHVLGPVKTKAARRVVHLPEVAARAFQRLPRDLDAEQFIFRTEANKPPRPDHLRDPMTDLCKRAGVHYLNIHGLRHVAAVLALKAVQDPHMVQRRLGHSHVNVTMGIYAYAAGNDVDVAAAVGRLLDTGAAAQGAGAI
jgi:integrase